MKLVDLTFEATTKYPDNWLLGLGIRRSQINTQLIYSHSKRNRKLHLKCHAYRWQRPRATIITSKQIIHFQEIRPGRALGTVPGLQRATARSRGGSHRGEKINNFALHIFSPKFLCYTEGMIVNKTVVSTDKNLFLRVIYCLDLILDLVLINVFLCIAEKLSTKIIVK